MPYYICALLIVYMNFKQHIVSVIVLIAIVFFNQSGYSQGRDYLDYMVTQNNDTIYGTFRMGIFKSYFLEFNRNGTTEEERYIEHSTKNIKAYRFNDFVTVSTEIKEDGIYGEGQDAERNEDFSKDYVVNIAGDTIHTRVYQPYLGKPYFVKENGSKQKIKGSDYKAYRSGEFKFEYVEKPKVNPYDTKKAFMMVLLRNDKITLYGYRDSYDVCYFAEMYGYMYFINRVNYKDQCKLLFGGNPRLMNLIDNNVYGGNNIYLIVKYYMNEPYRLNYY